ncbi:manganese efflux pump MntP [Henriciella litoralis]|uniref:manganese efflux pump MntP n=1 Tax=Henriciella litoralis TaxID=568102 RepID=UPI000A052A3F|nr:manganese efflux pump MntP family protein [Henriciella litoralis]
MVSFLTLLALAFGLSVDAFAAALGKGAGARHTTFTGALRIGFVFGGMEAAMPLIGFVIGLALAGLVANVDHWIAFVLLGGVGLHMIWEAFTGRHDDVEELAEETANGPIRGPRWIHLSLAALATSIDATVVGVSLAMMDANIWLACLIILVVTTTLCTIGVLIGRHAGRWLGHWAEVAGGVVLIAIGGYILLDHLSKGI